MTTDKLKFRIDQCYVALKGYIIFQQINKIKTCYGSLENYKKSTLFFQKLKTKTPLSKSEKTERARFNANFEIPKNLMEKLIGRPNINGKRPRITQFVLNKLKEEGIIRCINHMNIVRKDGNNFTKNNAYVIDFKYLDEYYNNPKTHSTDSDFYTKQQHELIDKYYFKFKKETLIMNAKPKKTKKVKTTKIQHNNDIPTEDIYEDKLIPRLQEYIDNRYISLSFAKTLLQRLNKSFNHLHEAKGGTCYEELNTQTSKSERRNIIDYIIKNYKELLEEDDYNEYKKTYRFLEN